MMMMNRYKAYMNIQLYSILNINILTNIIIIVIIDYIY